MTSLFRKVAREPLVHFLVIGALTFGLERALGRTSEVSSKIVVTSEVRLTLAEQLERAEGRPPTDAELETAIVRWTDEELLYRAGLERGLQQNDERVRERVAMKMGRILRESVIVPEPTEDELRAWFAEHQARFATPSLVDFTQVFVSGEGDAAVARANELLAELRQGADPTKMGDTFQGGRRYRKRKIADIETTFGDTFAAGLETQSEGTWERYPSRFGEHLVRLDRRSAEAAADFDASRLDVKKHWLDSRREVGAKEALSELRARWVIVRE